MAEPTTDLARTKTRTGWAIAVAILSYTVLSGLYIFGSALIEFTYFSAIGEGVTFSPTSNGRQGADIIVSTKGIPIIGMSGIYFVITALLSLVVVALAAYSALIVAKRCFPASNSEAVFYSFSTVVVIGLLANLVTGREYTFVALSEAAMAIAGAWFGRHYKSKRMKAHTA
jgi:hypothetical protein